MDPTTPRQEPEWIDTESTSERQIIDLRSIGMRHALALGKLHYHHASAPLPEQCHPQWLVLVFLLSGQQRYVIDGKEVGFCGGQMLRILPGRRYSTGAWPEQRGELAWLILRVTPFPAGAALGMSAGGARAVIKLLSKDQAPILHPLPQDAPRLIESALSWWERREEPLGREVIRNRISGLVMESAVVMQPSAEAAAQANDRRIHQVIAWLDEHPKETPSAAELAGMAGLSTTSFHLHFKRVTGSSPKDYWLRQHIERAARDLREHPDLTVTRVAHEYGFSSSQYFATVFRRYLGITPQGYREASGRDGGE